MHEEETDIGELDGSLLLAAASVGDARSIPDPRIDEETQRNGRQLLGGYSLKMEVLGKDPAYSYRWFAGDGGRITEALKAGYRPVTSDNSINVAGEDLAETGQWTSMITGRLDSGKPQLSYLMAIKKEFFEADQAEKAAIVDSTEDEILGRKADPNVYHEASINGKSGHSNPFSR